MSDSKPRRLAGAMPAALTGLSDHALFQDSRFDQAFLDRVEALILSSGFRHLSSAKLAEALGCSKRKLYQTAATKDDLIALVIARFFAGVRLAGWAAIDDAMPVDERIRVYLIPGEEGAKRLSTAFQIDIERTEIGREIYTAHQQERVAGLERLIQNGVDDGLIEGVNPRILAEMILLTVQRVRDPDFQAQTRMTYAEGVSHTYGILRRALRSGSS